MLIRNRTVGRPKRKRSKGAGRAVKVKPHRRTPRGPNTGKPSVIVDGYARGKGKKKRAARRSRRKK